MVLRGGVLAACVIGSLALNLGVLLSGTPAASTPAPRRSVQAPGQPSSMTVVRIAAAPLPTPPPAWDPEHLPPTGAGVATTTVAVVDTVPKPDPPSPPPELAPDSVPDSSPDADYLPRNRLTRAPAPQQTIDLDYPELAPSGRFRAVVTLFIDDRGVVQRVRIDEAGDSGLPPVLEDSTRQTFLRSTFAPGEVDGHPTRSQLRIEVEYATEPLHGDPQTAAR